MQNYPPHQSVITDAASPATHRPSRLWIVILFLVSLLGGALGGGIMVLVLRTPEIPTPQPVQQTADIIPVSYDASTAITDAVAQVGPAVVTVVNNLPPQQTLFGTIAGRTASGSGVIISREGYIVTNNHVVEGAESLDIILADGSTIPAALVGVDPYADLAVLKVENEMTPLASWGNSDTLKSGETVIAIGSPLGDFKNTVTVGVVSATERSIEVEQNFLLEGLIQTDAAINQGNSGGPLVNLAGQVVGINTLIVRGGVAGTAVAEGLGFAIPSNTARALSAQIIEKGYVSRPHLGIRWGWITPSLANRYRLPVEYGVYVSEVSPDSAVARAGLRRGDIIVAINSQMLDEEHPFINQLFQYEPGQTVTFTIVRDGNQMDIEVLLEDRPAP